MEVSSWTTRSSARWTTCTCFTSIGSDRKRWCCQSPANSPDQLLIPPVLTNKLGWVHGYFETIAHHRLAASDRLPQHCFRSGVVLDAPIERYYDEYSRELDVPVEPVGEWGLQSYRTIDDAVSDALGIPRAG